MYFMKPLKPKCERRACPVGDGRLKLARRASSCRARVKSLSCQGSGILSLLTITAAAAAGCVMYMLLVKNVI